MKTKMKHRSRKKTAALTVIASSVVAASQVTAADTTNATTTATSNDKKMISLAEAAPELYYAFRRYPEFYGDPNTTLGSIWDRTQLLGNLGGLRDKAVDKGIYLDVSVTQFAQGNVAGGNTQGPVHGNGTADYWLTLDSGKAGLWSGGGIFLHAESSWLADETINGDTGSLLPANFDAVMPTPNISRGIALPELYFAQGLPADLMLIAGKLNFSGLGDQNVFANNERTQFEYTGLVNNPILGAFIPYTPLGLALVWAPSQHHTVALLGTQANGNATTTGFDEFNGEYTGGLQYQYSTKFADRLPGNYRILLGYSSKEIMAYDIDPRHLIEEIIGIIPPIDYTENYALLINFDQYLWTREETKEAIAAAHRIGMPPIGFGIYFRAGWAPADRNVIDQFYSAGIGGYGMIPGRDRDQWGVGWAGTHISNDLRDDVALANIDLNNFENAFEAFYNFAVTPATHVTANVQVINSVNPAVDTAVVIGTRFQFDF